ncbi:MAG: hypothetical protein KatS3mg124_0641 [Porticoccaceae bacterium]|nr:MAG: hypothetical protein KatS3mg124_0641 [Porticoccaceae bacterium]
MGRDRGGFHHGALWVEDYAATLTVWRRSGFEVAFEGRMLGAPTCYLDALATLGFFVEVISANPAAAAVFSAMRAAARNWDGTAPLRRLGEAPQR